MTKYRAKLKPNVWMITLGIVCCNLGVAAGLQLF